MAKIDKQIIIDSIAFSFKEGKKRNDILPKIVKKFKISSRTFDRLAIIAKKQNEGAIKKNNNNVGRPTKFNQETCDKILDLISTTNRGLASICKELNITCSTVFKWITDNKEFSDNYARAREAQADFLADEILEISEHTKEDQTPFTGINVIQRDKLRIDTRKWIASKLKPKKYGDKLDLTSGGDKLPDKPNFVIQCLNSDIPIIESTSENE